MVSNPQEEPRRMPLRIRDPISITLLILALWTVPLGNVAAIDEFQELLKIDRLPKTKLEIESSFRKTRGAACELVPPGQPLEVRNYTTILTTQDKRKSQDKILIPSKRQNLFTVGLEFSASDKSDLPTLSRNKILQYVEENYVSIQGRQRRDLLDRKPYFHHRPIAVTVDYRGRISKSFEPIIASTIRDFHGLGLFVENKDAKILKPEMFRTLVMMFRSPVLEGNRIVDKYEFVFVRGVVDRTNQLRNYVFCTSEDRKILHFVSSSQRPNNSRMTSILGRIAITKYDSAGLYPKSSAIRSHRIADREQYSVENLDRFCERQDLTGGYSRNLTVVLDAIIDRKIAGDSQRGL